MANWRTVSRAAFAVLFVSMLIAGSKYDDYLMRNRPDHPDGLFVIEQPAHGSFYYITQHEHLISLGFWLGMFVIFLFSAVFEIILEVNDQGQGKQNG